MPRQRVLLRPAISAGGVTVTPVYPIRHRLLRERLLELLRRIEIGGEQAIDDDIVRLAVAALTLLDRHQLDGKGRCRRCRSFQPWWPFRKRQRCLVYTVISFYLDEPVAVIQWQVVGLLERE